MYCAPRQAPGKSHEAVPPRAAAEATLAAEEPPAPEKTPAAEEPPSAIPEHHRRDTRSLKDRFNYASGDCAAVVLKANREARGMTAILNSKKDQYMLNECSARNKFVVVELCDDILIDTLVLGNYEFFSSTFKDVMVHASDRYPPKDKQWTFIGHFQGFNSRDAQVFPVVDPKIWARYLMLEFVTHYGNEFYCPLTVLGVYGATQMEQYRKEAEEEEELAEPATLAADALLSAPLLDYQLRLPHYQYQQHPSQNQHQPLRIAGAASHAKAYLQDMQGLVNEYQERDMDEPRPVSRAAPIPRVPSLPWARSGEVKPSDGGNGGSGGSRREYDDEDNEDDEEGAMDPYDNDDEESVRADSVAAAEMAGGGAGDNGAKPQAADECQHQPCMDPDVRLPSPKNSGTGVDGSGHTVAGGGSGTDGNSGARQQTIRSMGGQQQRGQESIFKTIMRRLARVERNVTLAYRYLEEQHMVFNLVLQQVEMSSLETMQLAIDQLNRTTTKQMQSLTTLSEEVWRAILYDLEEYQQKTESEMGEVVSRLEFLAEEVLFEKRMNVAQLVLLLTIVALIAVNKAVTKLALIPEAKKER